MMMTCYPLQKLHKGAVSANLTSRKQLAEMLEDLLEVQQPEVWLSTFLQSHVLIQS